VLTKLFELHPDNLVDQYKGLYEELSRDEAAMIIAAQGRARLEERVAAGFQKKQAEVRSCTDEIQVIAVESKEYQNYLRKNPPPSKEELATTGIPLFRRIFLSLVRRFQHQADELEQLNDIFQDIDEASDTDKIALSPEQIPHVPEDWRQKIREQMVTEQNVFEQRLSDQRYSMQKSFNYATIARSIAEIGRWHQFAYVLSL
jgi:hypothetical protein